MISNRSLRLTACFLVALAVTLGCAPSSSRDGAEIRTRSQQWQTALNAGDLDTLVALYTADARVLPPNAAMGSGQGAVRDSFGAMIDAGLSGRLESVEATIAGDVGYNVGRYSISSDGTVVDSGKFVEIWRLDDGQWKIASDIWNSDLPTGAPSGTLLSASHEVVDPARWLAAWGPEGSRHEQFARHGVNSVRVMQSPDDPKLTGLLIDVADMAAFTSFLASEAGTRAKKEDGVREKTIRILAAVPD